MSCSEYKPVFVSCPAYKCDDKEPGFWSHGGGCKNRTELNSDAMLRCSTCKKPNSVLNWKWACEKHENEFRPVDAMGIMHAIGVMRSMSTDLSQKAWGDRLGKSIKKELMSRDDI